MPLGIVLHKYNDAEMAEVNFVFTIEGTRIGYAMINKDAVSLAPRGAYKSLSRDAKGVYEHNAPHAYSPRVKCNSGHKHCVEKLQALRRERDYRTPPAGVRRRVCCQEGKFEHALHRKGACTEESFALFSMQQVPTCARSPGRSATTSPWARG